jgi:multicomponent Na+:H+ antiporter subunit D
MGMAGMVCVALLLLSGRDLGSVFLVTSTFEEAAGMSPLSFAAHPYGRIAAFSFLMVGAMALLYGLEVYKRGELAAAIIAVSSAVAVAFSANFLTLFIFWELLTLSTTALILFNGTEQSKREGFRYLLFHLAGGLALFLGIMQNYAASGSFAIMIPEAGLPFFFLAVGIKCVFLPLYIWLPWSYPSGSFAATVVLAGLSTKVGVFALARFLPPHILIVAMGASMALFGAVMALLQNNMRRLLCYSIISKVGYLVAGVGLGLAASVDGSFLHMLNHMLYKALLLMCAGAILYTTGTEEISELTEARAAGMSPVWLIAPVAVIGAVIGGLSIIGVPFLNGYTGNYLIKKGIQYIHFGAAEWLFFLAGAATTAAIAKLVWFGFLAGRAAMLKEMTVSMKTAIAIVALCCIILGIRPQPLTSLLPNQTSLDLISWSGAWAALQPVFLGIAGFAVCNSYLRKNLRFPAWLSVEYLVFRPVLAAVMTVFICSGRVIDTIADGSMVRGIPYLLAASRGVANFDERTLKNVGGSVAASSGRVRDGIHDAWVGGISALLNRCRSYVRLFFYFLIKVDYDPKGERIFQVFNFMNFDFDFIIFIIILLLLLGASIFLL